tara:strand:+ start:4789 stop:5133 length:345 start_codon:yes stop_codon:yes gene_type:complete
MDKAIYTKRARRLRRKLKNINMSKLRISVYRSSRNISAQIIDDRSNKTLVSASSIKEKNINKKKGDLSILVAELLAKRALEKKINKVYFDKGAYKYHGRIKIFAETLRKNGLNF